MLAPFKVETGLNALRMGADRVVFPHMQLNIHNNKGILTGRIEGLSTTLPPLTKLIWACFCLPSLPSFIWFISFFFSLSLSTRFYQQFRMSLSSNSEHTTSREKKVLSPYTVYMFKDKMARPSTTVKQQQEPWETAFQHRMKEWERETWKRRRRRERDMTPEKVVY
jgi:hypothetical protein